jgi:DNA-binding transcriptional ArsR family regulator
MKPPHSTLSVRDLSLFNVGRMPSGKVIAAFSARMDLFRRILSEIAAEKPKSLAQHHLIVGQRGMGKTMLLARIAAELRTEAGLAARFIPLVFAEEQYSVDRLSRFWLNCLDSLADACESGEAASAVAELDGTVARLTSGTKSGARDEVLFAEEAHQLFAAAVARIGRRPVLFVDNLQLVFDRLESSQQHSLREVLMRPGSPILIGASPTPLLQTEDYGAAFYDHFKVHHLRPLDDDEMRSLLLHLAEASGRDDVRKRVLENPTRVKVLRQLVGGNPRTTMILFFLYAEDFSSTAFGDLEGLLDRVTPLYKARFEELTAQQQVITSAIANHWDPCTASQLVLATALPAGTISSQLDRLEKTGTVERVELFGEARSGYQLAERFFNIWFLMRSASRRQRREVEFLARFLESFCDKPELTRSAGELMEDALPPQDRLFLRRDFMGEGAAARPLLAELDALPDLALSDTRHLHEALFCAYENNWGLACEALAKAIEVRKNGLSALNTDDWLRAAAVFIHLNQGWALLDFFAGLGDAVARLRPWVEAVRAVEIGDKLALKNIAPEIRVTAEVLFDGIEDRLSKFPERTGRRPVTGPLPKATRAKGGKRRVDSVR